MASGGSIPSRFGQPAMELARQTAWSARPPASAAAGHDHGDVGDRGNVDVGLVRQMQREAFADGGERREQQRPDEAIVAQTVRSTTTRATPPVARRAQWPRMYRRNAERKVRQGQRRPSIQGPAPAAAARQIASSATADEQGRHQPIPFGRASAQRRRRRRSRRPHRVRPRSGSAGRSPIHGASSRLTPCSTADRADRPGGASLLG